MLAERTLTIVTATTEYRVPIVIELPVQNGEAGWSCSYRIGWPDEPWQSRGWGIDAVQAIYLTLEKIGMELYSSPYHKAGELRWQDKEGYGFPVPSNGYDLLVGADKHFAGRRTS